MFTIQFGHYYIDDFKKRIVIVLINKENIEIQMFRIPLLKQPAGSNRFPEQLKSYRFFYYCVRVQILILLTND